MAVASRGVERGKSYEGTGHTTNQSLTVSLSLLTQQSTVADLFTFAQSLLFLRCRLALSSRMRLGLSLPLRVQENPVPPEDMIFLSLISTDLCWRPRPTCPPPPATAQSTCRSATYNRGQLWRSMSLKCNTRLYCCPLRPCLWFHGARFLAPRTLSPQ